MNETDKIIRHNLHAVIGSQGIKIMELEAEIARLQEVNRKLVQRESARIQAANREAAKAKAQA